MFKEAFRPATDLLKNTSVFQTIFKTLAENEGVQNASLEFMRRRLNSGQTKLSPLGEIAFNNTMEAIKNGDEVILSDCIGILMGSSTTVSGNEILKKLKNTGALLILNHSSEGHLRGYGNTIVVSQAVKDSTGKDPIWTHGGDKSTLQDFSRPKISKSIKTIAIRDKKGEESLFSMFRKIKKGEIIGIYPEGDSGKKLKKGVSNAGRLISGAIARNIPVIYGSSYFDIQSQTYCTTFFEINPEIIIEIGEKDKMSGQKVIDCIMLQIAQHLPPEKRGYYADK